MYAQIQLRAGFAANERIVEGSSARDDRGTSNNAILMRANDPFIHGLVETEVIGINSDESGGHAAASTMRPTKIGSIHRYSLISRSQVAASPRPYRWELD